MTQNAGRVTTLAALVLAVNVYGQTPTPHVFKKHVLAWADVRNGYQHDSITHALASTTTTTVRPRCTCWPTR